jgi:glutamyl-Q tRNA(Asp) synthetase
VATTRRNDPAIRLRVPDGSSITFHDGLQGDVTQEVAREVGDFVLKRADGPWAYQLAVVVDDAAQGMTDTVRGADLLDSTPRQILLQRALGLPTPRYLHLPIVLDAAGHKLSKSSAALPVDANDPLHALQAAWRVLGQDPSALHACGDIATTLQTARAAFVPQSLPKCASSPLAAVHNTADANAV